ncbi:YdeI/OmpD-associated family protein [Paenibacillus wynnii]|uniref:YdeI/OmpD-associated family protein n=1 Tax=Paenibacillus wynnii TaxID=268407 RepID=UPI0027949262|nr:YdeI/OmpD-associated family protein [Paenibacillus wynnii]MDQ0192241.1 hypothetical protein [Paenibacillus wynnii]
MKNYIFEAEILQHGDMDAAYIVFPYDVQVEFGTQGQVKVKATFDGIVEYRGSLAKMGRGSHCLGITKQIRQTLGVKFGDAIQVVLVMDLEPRTIDIPDDLLQALSELNILESFSSLSYSKQKKRVDVILGSKKQETRTRNIQKLTVSLLSDPS